MKWGNLLMDSSYIYKSNVDVPVLLIFFSRPGCFAQVFEQVKKARPSKLFLYQDGPREGNQKDIEGIRKCREIAEDIDWDCEVHKLYQEKNFGCDPSGFLARKWAFEYVDRCIILEDDCVPSQSFFPFCKELLERYADDERVEMICGMNNLEYFDTPYSYLFSSTGSGCGVATWKRILDQAESNYEFLNPGYDLELFLKNQKYYRKNPKNRLKTWQQNRDSGVEHHETILGVGQLINNRLNIVSAVNQIKNVGNSPEGGTHAANGVETIPKGLRRIFTMDAHEIEFPLKHPKYMIEDISFKEQLERAMGSGHPIVQMWRKIEKAFLIMRYEGFKSLLHKIQTR